MTPRRLAVAVAVLVAVTASAVLVWWLSRGPQVAPAARAGDPACTRAAHRYPPTLGPLRRTGTDVPGVARYGDPAVVVRCGAAPPGPTTEECVSIDGVDWVVHPLSDGSRLTTYGRDPALEILVPAAHGPGPLLAPALGPAASELRDTGRRCVG